MMLCNAFVGSVNGGKPQDSTDLGSGGRFQTRPFIGLQVTSLTAETHSASAQHGLTQQDLSG